MNNQPVPTASKELVPPSGANQNQAVHYHKLDVLNSTKINRVTRINITVWSVLLLYSVFSAIVTNTILLTSQKVQCNYSGLVSVRDVVIHRGALGFEMLYSTIACFALLSLAVIYPFRVLFNNKYPVTHTQVSLRNFRTNYQLYLFSNLIYPHRPLGLVRRYGCLQLLLHASCDPYLAITRFPPGCVKCSQMFQLCTLVSQSRCCRFCNARCGRYYKLYYVYNG